MPKKISDDQRAEILHRLSHGEDRDTIAAATGVTPGQVSAISAHVKMGTYQLPEVSDEVPDGPSSNNAPPPVHETTANLLSVLREHLQHRCDPIASETDFDPILIGAGVETGEPVYWNPDASTGSANPHVLILGESGFGKTYTITCLIAELSQRNVVSIVFDYGQGFTKESLPKEFVAQVNLVEMQASRDGVDINPLQIFPSDILGPVNVAQRVADTFARVYQKLGVQQHAALRQSVLDAMADEGILPGKPDTWDRQLPAFRTILTKLEALADTDAGPRSKAAASVASHISTLFVFNTFRPNGRQISWSEILRTRDRVIVLQLKGLESSLERAVTEFLLWNLIGYVESAGPGPLSCFAVLDEAHKLSCDRGSPVEKLLREGRKFGVGLILASQQPEDFSQVAFSNTATKIVFQISDEKSGVSRRLHRKIRNAHTFADVYQIITKLPRGNAYVLSDNIGRITRIASYSGRSKKQ